jgi:hypothetical protein
VSKDLKLEVQSRILNFGSILKFGIWNLEFIREGKMKKTLVTTICLCLALMVAAPALAGEMAGVTMEDSISIGDATVTLAGMGIRNKLVVKVYVAGLYMTEPELSQEAIIGSDQAKALHMHFLYKNVGAEKLQDAWREGFEKNTPDATEDLKERMDTFVSLFTEDALKDDEYLFAYVPGVGTTVTLKNRESGTIPGEDFARALFAIWFGDHPADKGLKKSVLKGF